MTAVTPGDRIREQIHDYIVADFLFDADELDDGASLIEEGILDSIGVLQMVLFVEEQLGIQVDDVEVLPANFGSVDALSEFVLRRKAADGTPSVA